MITRSDTADDFRIFSDNVRNTKLQHQVRCGRGGQSMFCCRLMGKAFLRDLLMPFVTVSSLL
jgi:hypothetical protein